MTPKLCREEGWALVTAMMLLTMMLASTLALAAFVDTETRETGIQRQRETAFNYAEAAINAQVYALSQRGQWAGPSATGDYPTCGPTTGTTRCPADAQIKALFPTADVTPDATWSTSVRDNVLTSPNFYSDALITANPPRDANNDGQVWVRAEATIRGRKRVMVALVREQSQQEAIPHAALLAGRLSISNQGNKVIIDAGGGSAQSGLVAVRCGAVVGETLPCVGHKLGTAPNQTAAKLQGTLNQQISPNVAQDAFVGGEPCPAGGGVLQCAMSQASLDRLKDTAKTYGTYFESCPSTLTGKVVWLNVAATTRCTYTGNTTFNSESAPGVLIIESGSLQLGGGITYYGVAYHTYLATAATAFELQGNATIRGGVIVDGNGMVVAGSNGLNIVVDERGFDAVRSIATAGIVQNTWRELIPSPGA